MRAVLERLFEGKLGRKVAKEGTRLSLGVRSLLPKSSGKRRARGEKQVGKATKIAS
jgi:hypothetical protein